MAMKWTRFDIVNARARGRSMQHARRRATGTLLALVAAQLLVLPQAAHAGACDSAARIATELWDEYGKYAKQGGCRSASTTALVASSGATGDPEVIYRECLDNINQREQMVRRMIASWNRLAANSWATIGPRKLLLDEALRGTIVGPAARLYVTPAPVHTDAIDIAIEKRQFGGLTNVTVCSYAPGGHKAKRWSFSITPVAEAGRLWLQRIPGVKGQLLSVHLVGKSVVRKMRYQLEASPAAASPRADAGDGGPGATAGAAATSATAPAATVDRLIERQGEVVASCQATAAAPRDLRRAGGAPSLRAALPATPTARQPSSPRLLHDALQPAARNVIAFTSDGGWVVARGTRSFSRNIPDEAHRKLNEYTRSGKPVEAIAFTPAGGWTVVARGVAWTRNVGGGYHERVQSLVRAGKRMRAVAFNPAGWEARRGYVVAYEGGFAAEHIPVEMCSKLKELTRAERSLDAVAFTPDGGWTVVAGRRSWTRNVGGPSPNYYDAIRQLVSGGGRAHAVAFNPAQYGSRRAWLVLTDGGFRGRAVPAETVEQLRRTLGLSAIDAH